MSTEIQNQGCGWSNGNFDLTEEFAKGSFDKLIEYCDENELNLMHIWKNKDITEISKILRYGTALLKYFEATIDKDPKVLTAFKLGELSGHLDCLNQLSYENQQNNFVRIRFEEVKLSRPNLKKEFEEIIKIFSREGRAIKEEELINKLNLNLIDLRDILNELTKNQFLHFYELLGYSLSDAGIRLAKELSKLNII